MNQTAEQAVPQKTVKIGEYILTGKIGQGGIAEIYKARQGSLNRDVAIKILSKSLCDDPDIVRRFERESLVIAHLNHPNIVHVIDKGMAVGRYYFVLEFVDGTSLRQVIDSEKISINTKIESIVQVCKGLDYAHKNGVIHRDIKPANILIDREGNAMITDFGIAQIVGGDHQGSDTTSADIIMGTLSYMSPEQKISSRNVDQTTDIYSVGVIIYEILCGKKPMGQFKPPSENNPNLNAEFDEIVAKCMAQDPSDRYQTAVELKDALLHAINEGAPSNNREVSVTGSTSFMGKCRYLDTIKESRYSTTFLVENQLNKNLYVIKKHSRGEAGRKEAKLLSSLNHKNVIGIFGSGGDTKSTIVIAEYAPGGSLADRMARKYDWEEAMNIAVQIAAGLDIAHRNNLVHGNLRPSNVLFDVNEVVKLTDFGMPAHYNESDSKQNWFAPPEHKNSRLGDIYSLGVIVYLMITGKRPLYDKGSKLILESMRLRVPEKVKGMLRKLLAIRVSQRFQSCEEFIAEYDDFNRGSLSSNDSDILMSKENDNISSLSKRHYVIFTAIAVAVLVIGVVIGYFLK